MGKTGIIVQGGENGVCACHTFTHAQAELPAEEQKPASQTALFIASHSRT